MTNDEARVILKNDADFVYGAGNDSYDRQAYVVADKALENMDKIKVLIDMDTTGNKSIKLSELKEVIGMNEPRMTINKYLEGKTILKATVTGYNVILTFSDGDTFNYDATDGGWSSWELTDADGNDVNF